MAYNSYEIPQNVLFYLLEECRKGNKNCIKFCCRTLQDFGIEERFKILIYEQACIYDVDVKPWKYCLVNACYHNKTELAKSLINQGYKNHGVNFLRICENRNLELFNIFNLKEDINIMELCKLLYPDFYLKVIENLNAEYKECEKKM